MEEKTLEEMAKARVTNQEICANVVTMKIIEAVSNYACANRESFLKMISPDLKLALKPEVTVKVISIQLLQQYAIAYYDTLAKLNVVKNTENAAMNPDTVMVGNVAFKKTDKEILDQKLIYDASQHFITMGELMIATSIIDRVVKMNDEYHKKNMAPSPVRLHLGDTLLLIFDEENLSLFGISPDIENEEDADAIESGLFHQWMSDDFDTGMNIIIQGLASAFTLSLPGDKTFIEAFSKVAEEGFADPAFTIKLYKAIVVTIFSSDTFLESINTISRDFILDVASDNNIITISLHQALDLDEMQPTPEV